MLVGRLLLPRVSSVKAYWPLGVLLVFTAPECDW